MSYYIIAFIAVLCNIIGQMFLKKSVLKKKETVVSIYLNIFAISAYILLVVSTVFTVVALRGLELKELVFILPISYIAVPLLATYIFEEKLNYSQLIGIFVIFVGIIVYNSSKLF